ncbi:MAG: DUF433 domain-containing protein [Anaerolineae bacterium]|nr:DUF433 domain-containing protein [Anaerolineae bacterium]
MMASLPVETIPIRVDEHNRLRVGNTRVLLELVVYSFRLGNTPETITDQYPSLSLEDVYLAIGYYLRHRDEIDTYLREQEEEASQARREWEAKHPPTLTREILLARLDEKRPN